MKCPNCNFEIAENTKFCPECGTKIKISTESPEKNVMESTTSENVVETVFKTENASQKSKKEKKPKNKKAIKIVTLTSIATVLIVAIVAIVCAAFFLIIPKIKYNKAIETMESGDYVVALYLLNEFCYEDFFDASIYSKCAENALNQLVEEQKFEKAVSLYKNDLNKAYITAEVDKNFSILLLKNGKINEIIDLHPRIAEDAGYFEDFSVETSKEQDKLYEAIEEYLDTMVLTTDSDGYDYISRSRLKFASLLLSKFPHDYKNAWRLKMLCDSLTSSYRFDRTVLDNKGHIEDFWKYGVFRQVAGDFLEAFLFDTVWETSDGKAYLSFKGYIDFGDPKLSDFLCIGLERPSVAHKSWEIDNENRTLIYTNDGYNTKVCDVFKFEFDEKNPYILRVYCYENGETITLTRK